MGVSFIRDSTVHINLAYTVKAHSQAVSSPTYLEFFLVLQLFGPRCVTKVVFIVLECLVHVDDDSAIIISTRSKTLLIQDGKHTLWIEKFNGI